MSTFLHILHILLCVACICHRSLDEEGINLLHYQQSYSAAARLMTTLDEALDKLINGTGVVGR